MVTNKQIYQRNKPYGYTARVTLQGGLASAQFVNAGHNDAILHFEVLIIIIYMSINVIYVFEATPCPSP